MGKLFNSHSQRNVKVKEMYKKQVQYQLSGKRPKRPFYILTTLLILILSAIAATQLFAQETQQALSGGDELQVTCSADHLQVVPVNATELTVSCMSNNTPDPTPTDEPQPPTPDPTDEPEPPSPDPTATVPAPPPPSNNQGIWISSAEIASLPTSGSSWDNMLRAAQQNTGSPNISNQDDNTDVYVMAKALVYARTGETRYRDDVVKALRAAIGSESGGRTLALGRNLPPYIIAADLINLSSTDPGLDRDFRSWLNSVRTKSLDGRSLIETHEDRPNNWGTHAGAARAAIAVYLGDTADLTRTAAVFHGWLGDRSAYSGFSYGDLSWQCNSSKPVGINPSGCSKDGHNIDGALPEEMRRGGSFQWPPKSTGYAWEGMQGAIVQAEILHRAGFDTWNWENQALRRAADFLYRIGWEASGDDRWQPWLLNSVYGTNYPASAGTSPGKGMGWTDWTHQ